ncbi:hypothetical protein ABIF38_002663 [Bradyrhizobium japonicum]|jgi:hypothetical protein|uniref:Uncharacterized protein n=1 Tax=Bradyrhizobium elkanii TaxID=29448 RepID=A0A8I2C384_BRAEL|nr:hypothetical protein [Bradyrhizobium elkanii]MCS4010389.1 hypothetical protein [Bradyrhizobium elkanii USDA 61]MBP2431902.1 hypothetical protein [Bradyrhizobium elkanii]MCP1735024.1 hypothetical protein [Bradyrhizobium elkanii]MCP1752569.1 hypothetical protein [Bradyrhizobium elkanii]
MECQMAKHFMGAATFLFECAPQLHDFPNFVL